LSQLAVIYSIVFCAVLLAVQGAYWFYAERRKSQGAINRRLVLAAKARSTQDTLELLRRERGLSGFDEGRFGYLNKLVVQTGLRLEGKFLMGVAFGVGVIFFGLFGIILGYGLITFIFSGLFGALSMLLFLTIVRGKRIGKFGAQLPDAIDVIVRGVKSGYPFTVALGLVGKEMIDPIGTEFGMVSDEVNFGSAVGTALDNLYHRVGHEDLLYMTMALKIQNETGGNLAEILSRLGRLLRERAMLRLKVRAISAEGRLSAIFLTAMPFVIFGIVTLMNPNFYSGVLGNPITMPAIMIGSILLVVGNIIIYRMVHFKV
jgi:tight adherence protein B